jgi:hypothetical protein
MKCTAQEYLHPPKIAKVEEEENEGREDEAREGENGEDKGEKQVQFISCKIGNTISHYLDGERCCKECLVSVFFSTSSVRWSTTVVERLLL